MVSVSPRLTVPVTAGTALEIGGVAAIGPTYLDGSVTLPSTLTARTSTRTSASSSAVVRV